MLYSRVCIKDQSKGIQIQSLKQMQLREADNVKKQKLKVNARTESPCNFTDHLSTMPSENWPT